MELTAAQAAVVDHDGPRAVVQGGVGTGKTTTLTARYLGIVEGLPASRVLVVAQNRDAARRFTDVVLPRLRGGFDRLPITTVYGLALELLTGALPAVRLLSSAEQRVRIAGLLAEEDPADWPVLGHLIGRESFAEEVVRGLTALDAATPAGGGAWADLALFASRYRAALAAEGRIDAGGLLTRAATAVEGTAQAPAFDHVVVDDADLLPAAGLRLLEALLATGVPATLSAASDLPPALVSGLSLFQRLEERFRVAPPGTLVRCGHPSIEPEAVAFELLEARAAGAPWSGMAVLVRHLGARARAIGRALARHGIPVVPVPALAREEPVVKAVVDLLRWVDDDGAPLDGLLVSPLSGLDAPTVRSVRREAARSGQPVESLPELAPLVAIRDHLRGHLTAGDSPADLAYEAWAKGLAHVLGREFGSGLGAVDDRALDALVALVDGMARFADDNPGAGLGATLAALDAGALTPDPWRSSGSLGSDGVTITSIAAAAGREWDTVIVAGCVEGELPRVRLRDRLFDPAVLSGAVPAPDQRRREALHDERQLFALATSRATRRLLATAAPQPGVLLSRFVEGWSTQEARLPLAPGQAPPDRGVTAGASPLFPDGALRLSATQLDTYADCPLRYAFRYVLRARDEPGVHASLGSLVHETLATFLNPENPVPRTFESLMAVADGVWRDDVARYRPQVEEARRDFVNMLKSWWEQEGDPDGALAPEVLAVERRFDFELGPHRLVGFIDRIDRADDGVGVRVVDYKTGKREPSAADVAEDLQLAVYHLAASRDRGLATLGPPTQLQLRYLRSMRTYHLPVSHDLAARTEERVLATAGSILAGEFSPAVDANCRTCSFHRLCPLQRPGRQVGQP